jgi:hypothetical protein
VKTICAFCPSSCRAHDLARGALLPCVSQVTIFSGRPLTPPFALICFTRICAAASAGPSNGAIDPLVSNAQPMVIGVACGAAPTFAATARLANTASAAASTATLLVLLMHPPRLPVTLTGVWLVLDFITFERVKQIRFSRASRW